METSTTSTQSVHKITEVAMLISLAFVLEVIASALPRQPQGGSVTISLIPLIIIAYRRGFATAFTAGVIFGLLNWMLAGFVIWVHWMEGPLDYLLANGVVAVTAFYFAKHRQQAKYFAIAGVIGGFARYFIHYLSGIIFFREFADGHWAIYSLTYNGVYMIPTIILVSVLGYLVYQKMAPQIEEQVS